MSVGAAGVVTTVVVVVVVVLAAPLGVTAFDVADEVPAPEAAIAMTMKVYVVPLVSPATVQVAVGAVAVQAILPGLEMTEYDTGVAPEEGAVQVTTAWAFPAVAVTYVGAPAGAT